MRILVFIALLFWGGSCFAQPLKKIEKLLADKNFSAFKAYTDSSNGKKKVHFYWKILSEIIPGYQQAVINIEETLPYNKIKKKGGYINNYIIRLLEHKGDIFYYDYCITKYESGRDSTWHEHDDTIVFLKNKQAYIDFKNAYVTTFHDTLNEKELFTQDVYGQGCGLAGVVPEGQVQLDSLLACCDITAIRKWLKSPIAERQLYAIEGFRALVCAGYTLTDEEERLLEIVKYKKATVETCSGCFFNDESFGNMVKEIEETPGKYLTAKVHRQERLFNRFPIKNKHETMVVFFVPAFVIGVIIIILYRRKYLKV